MPRYKCRYMKPGAKDVIEQELFAGSGAELRRQLEKMDNFVLTIQRTDPGLMGLGLRWRKKIRHEEFHVFNQELAVLLKAGLPVAKALDTILERGRKTELSILLKSVRDDIVTGESLSGAFSKRAHAFSRLYIASLEAGEKSGDVPQAIGRHIVYLKKMAELRRKVISAMIYPMILTGVSGLTLVFMMLYVVPTFTASFFETGTKLPAVTRFLIQFSQFFRSSFGLIIVGMVCLAGILFAMRKSEKGRMMIDGAKLTFPGIGRVYQYYYTSVFSRSLATILSGGTPLLESLRTASGTIENLVLQEMLTAVATELEQGSGFALALEKHKTLPHMAVRMISAGESGGALSPVLSEVADFYESDVNDRLGRLTAAIEPALMGLMGVVIGGIVLAMYMPIFELAGTVG